MSTHAYIGYQREDGQIVASYLHFDGYLRHTGKTLINYYDGRERAKALVHMGEMSSLRKEIGEKQPLHLFGIPKDQINPEWENWTKFYERDNNETGVGPRVYSRVNEFKEVCGSYHLYMHTIEAGWRVLIPGNLYWWGLRKAVEREEAKA